MAHGTMGASSMAKIRRKITKLATRLFLVPACASLMVCTAVAASWAVLDSKSFGKWQSTLNRNNRTQQLFCAAETSGSNGTVFRLNFYKSANGQFLEAFNQGWDLIEGPGKFSMAFDHGYELEFSGKAYSDAYTYDFVENKKVDLVFGLMAKGKQFDLVNANGSVVSSFSLEGARDALAALQKCRERE